MGLREFNLTSIIPGVNAWASEKGRTILLDETTTNQNCSRLFPQGLKEVLHRSEEHTSELQSQSNLVCRLLLEKKFRPLTDACSSPVSCTCDSTRCSKLSCLTPPASRRTTFSIYCCCPSRGLTNASALTARRWL